MAENPADSQAQDSSDTRAIAFGGGGLWFLAWTLAFGEAAIEAGIPLDKADKTVGTSAGSLGAPILLSGAAQGVVAKAEAVAQHPEVMAQLLHAAPPAESQKRAAEVLASITDTTPESIQAVGRAAMAAHNPSPEAYIQSLKLVLSGIDWPGDKHHVTAVDCYTGELVIIDKASGIPLEVACAASSSLAGINGPTWVGDQLCMDGGTTNSSTHSEVVSDASKVLIFSLLGADAHPKGSFGLAQRTNPDVLKEELAAIEAKGGKGLVVSADPPDGINFMDPSGMEQALEMGKAAFAEHEQEVREFWGS